MLRLKKGNQRLLFETADAGRGRSEDVQIGDQDVSKIRRQRMNNYREISKMFKTLEISWQDKANTLPPILHNSASTALEQVMRSKFRPSKTLHNSLDVEDMNNSKDVNYSKDVDNSPKDIEVKAAFALRNKKRNKVILTKLKKMDKSVSKELQPVEEEAGRQEMHEMILRSTSGARPAGNKRLAWRMDMNATFGGGEKEKDALPELKIETSIVDNRENKNILDKLEDGMPTDRRTEASLPSRRQLSPRRRGKEHEAVQPQMQSTLFSKTLKGSQVLDLKKVREEVQHTLKEEMRRDTKQSLIEKIQHPHLKMTKYYVSDVQAALLANKEDDHHIMHAKHILLCLRSLGSREQAQEDEDRLLQEKKAEIVKKLEAALPFASTSLPFKRTKSVRFNGTQPQASKFQEEEIKGLLFLDFDSVLLHASQLPNFAPAYDAILPTPSGQRKKFKITLRPFLFEFLERVKAFFNIIVYTTSSKYYAEKLAEFIDPNKTFFKALLSNEFCIQERSYSVSLSSDSSRFS